MTLPEALASIREAERCLNNARLDIADSWREVGAMLRELRSSKSLTQAEAAALVPRDASVVQRWEKGCIADANEIVLYITKLEEL